MPLICAKFGGTSLATGVRFLNIARIVRARPERKLIVVSAPGKRFEGDAKVTDLLLRYARLRDEEDWARIDARFMEIARATGTDVSNDLACIRERILASGDEAYAMSRGEYLSARILAGVVGYDFIDAADCIRFDKKGNYLPEESGEALRKLFQVHRGAVLPGFYGAEKGGRIRVFPRGGSDITGAMAARALSAITYENWTDVDGVYDRDPKDPAARLLIALGYRDMRVLCKQGADILHPDCLAPVKEADIPIHVMNSFRPEAPGTWIYGE